MPARGRSSSCWKRPFRAGRGPLGKPAGGLGVGGARVFVPDVVGEKLDEPPGGALAGARDQCRQAVEAGASQLSTGRDGGEILGHVGICGF